MSSVVFLGHAFELLVKAVSWKWTVCGFPATSSSVSCSGKCAPWTERWMAPASWRSQNKKNPLRLLFCWRDTEKRVNQTRHLVTSFFSSSWLKLRNNAIALQPCVSELGLIYGPAAVKINGIVVAPRRGCHNQNSVSKVWSWFIYPRSLCSGLWAAVTNEALMKLSRNLGDHIQEAWLNGWRAAQA